MPGLAAKPKIDIDVVIISRTRLAEAVARMQMEAEYTFHGDPYGDGMWTFTSGRGSHGARLYICGPSTPAHIGSLLFRDWLRSHPEDAASYAPLKRQLVVGADGDWARYTRGKSKFVEEIVLRASAKC